MAKTAAQRSKGYPISIKQEPEPLANIDNFLEGLITDASPDAIPQNALQVALNLEYFRKMLFRRNGYTPWVTAKPDSLSIQGVFPFTELTTGLNILRFTPSSVYKSTVGGWVQFTPDGISANSGGNNNYFWFATIDNRGFFTNGVDPIREVLPATSKYAALGNAPIYKYITGAFDRIIGANLVDTNPVPYQVGWCGETNYPEWDATVDISAGKQNLVSSPSGLSDEITGIFSSGQLLVVPREQSIWLATKQPSATAPFAFFSQLPHIGADLPRTIMMTDYGLTWVENSSSSVFVWLVGSLVHKPDDISISDKIKRSLRSALNNSQYVWASYSNETRNYSIFITPPGATTVTIFTYNFLTSGWTTGTIGGASNPTYSLDIPFSNATVTINDLSGSIADLEGTIDSLGGLTENATRVLGYRNGDLSKQETFSGFPGEATPSVSDITETSTTTFQSILGTKTIEIPIFDTIINLVRFSVVPHTIGTVTLSYSKDDGVTLVPVKNITFNSGQLGIYQFIQLKKSIKARRIIWYITTTDCMCSINGFYLRALTAGVSKE